MIPFHSATNGRHARETRTASRLNVCYAHTKKRTGARMRRAADTSLDVSTFQGIIGLISRVHCAHASNELRELFTSRERTIVSPFSNQFSPTCLFVPLVPFLISSSWTKLRRIIHIFKTIEYTSVRSRLINSIFKKFKD